MLEVQQDAFTLVLVYESGSDPSFSTTASSTNAMNVVLDFIGHIIVDDMLNVGKIEPFAGYICCHKDVLSSSLHDTNATPPATTRESIW
jgi:hypothetical protein